METLNRKKCENTCRTQTDSISCLSPRLRAIASLVREGAAVADIGTDHALLPIALIESGRAVRALATDLNEGPVRRAQAAAARFPEKITVRRADGLQGAEAFAPDHVIIAGMGGELIVRILSEAPFARDSGVRLLLQPMTHAADLRRWLAGNGFAIEEELLVREDRIYEVIAAAFCGIPYSLSPLEALLGPRNLARGDETLRAHAARRAEVLRREIAGRQSGGEDCRKVLDLLNALESAAAGGQPNAEHNAPAAGRKDASAQTEP